MSDDVMNDVRGMILCVKREKWEKEFSEGELSFSGRVVWQKEDPKVPSYYALEEIDFLDGVVVQWHYTIYFINTEITNIEVIIDGNRFKVEFLNDSGKWLVWNLLRWSHLELVYLREEVQRKKKGEVEPKKPLCEEEAKVIEEYSEKFFSLYNAKRRGSTCL